MGPQVLGASLNTCYVLKWTPTDLRSLTLPHSPCGFWAVKTIAICSAMSGIAALISELYQASGSAIFLVANVVPCVCFNCD